MCVCGILLFILFHQNSIHRRKIWSSDINHFRKVKTAWDLCARDMHVYVLLFPRHLLVYIFTWEHYRWGPFVPVWKVQYWIEQTHSARQDKIEFPSSFLLLLFRINNNDDEVSSTSGSYYLCRFIIILFR